VTTHCQPIWFDWAWLWVCVMVGLGSYRYCGCDRLGGTAYRPCCSVSFVCSLEFGACCTGMQTLKNGIQESSVFQRRSSVHLRLYFGHMTSFSPTTLVPSTGAAHLSIFIDALLRPQFQGTVLSLKFKVYKSVHHHTIPINQPTRCKNFPSLLLDVYVRHNMFRASSRPSSEAQQLQ
jgi:hypothetical protein